MKRNGRWRAVAAAGVVLGLVLVSFWQLVFTNLILVGVDSFLYFYPYRSYVAQALSEGRFPLWNPHLFMGAPLFANMQTAVLYPLHWPLLWLPAPQQVTASIVLHVMLAAAGMLAYVRSALRLTWPAAVTAAVVFALGGFLGAQAEHLNQLNCIAWLPWAVLLLDHAMGGESWRQRETRAGLPRVAVATRAPWFLALALVLALMILAGHAQSVFICLTGLGLYALLRPAPDPRGVRGWSGVLTYLRRYPVHGLVGLVLATGIAVLLTAVQLLPTLELSRLSVRSEGLTFREATSFSLNPRLLHHTLLPPYGVDLAQVFGEAYSEYVAYVGLIGLGLALLGVWYGWRRRPTPPQTACGAAAATVPIPVGNAVSTGSETETRPESDRMRSAARFFSVLAAVGICLALGRINPVYYLLYNLVPGFDAFRVPARWMLLYALGMAVLAAIGLERISQATHPTSGTPHRRLGYGVSLALIAVLCVELFAAGGALRYRQPTAPEAFSSLRPSIAHLKTDPGLHRFLSLSGITYDPGDLAEMRAIFAGQLPERAIYDYVVAAKEKEVLFYNLPLLYGLYSVDGYDGGLLPLRDFVTMQRLFLPEDRLSVDGRLREQLRDVPPGRLLSLLGVKYVITDKVYDVWIDGVFYDLQFAARLSTRNTPRIELTQLPAFPTTALGIVSYLDGAASVGQDAPVARVNVADEHGWSQTFELRAGQDTSEGRYGPDVAHKQARIGHTWRDDPSGSDYIALLPFDSPHRLTRVVIETDLPAGEFVLRGLSLVDTRTNTSQQLTLSTEGQYRLVHSGDVKIYANQAVLPRAFVVFRAEVIPDGEQTIARLRDPTADPADTVVLAAGEPLSGSGDGHAEIIHYTPEDIAIDIFTDSPGYLVLTDTFYPGWQATLDGQPVPILRADLMFRAVPVSPGRHSVELHYRPASVRAGLWVSLATALICLGLLAVTARRRKYATSA